MGLDAIVRSAVATANSVTASLQATVTHAAWIGNQGDGTGAFAAAVGRQAIVEYEERERTTPTGTETVTVPRVTFVQPIPATTPTDPVNAPRKNPIDPRDIFTLPDGTAGQVSSVEGIVDPSTNAPYMLSVLLG